MRIRGGTCAYCGRVVRYRVDGMYRVHLSNEQVFLGTRRLQCRGSGQSIDVSEAQRVELRKRWRDDDGWLFRTPSTPVSSPGVEAASPAAVSSPDAAGDASKTVPS